MRRNIPVETRINAPRPVLAYPGELRQILINLLQNAIDALPKGGRILIRVQPSRSWLRRHCRSRLRDCSLRQRNGNRRRRPRPAVHPVLHHQG